MTFPVNLVLIRHGQSEGNFANQAMYAGDDSLLKDPGFSKAHYSSWRLTNKGVKQAKLTGDWLRNMNYSFDKFYVSGYTRALETAGLLGFEQAKWTVDLRVREREHGEDGIMTLEQSQKRLDSFRDKKDYPLFWRPLNGESLVDASVRIKNFVETLHRKNSEKSVLIVCHGEIMRVFQMVIERWNQESYMSNTSNQEMNNCQLIHYSREDPQTNHIMPYLTWKMNVCPWKDNPDRFDFKNWTPLKRSGMTNQEILDLAMQRPRFFADIDESSEPDVPSDV